MATRRNRPRYEPDDLLGLVLSAPLLWPGRTVRLERDSLLDCMGRSASAQVSVAELYHENSKLNRAHLPELFYAIELRLVTGADVYAYEPAAATFRLVKRLASHQIDELAAALGLMEPAHPSAGNLAYVLVLGCFPRNEILLGPRGYRRTLLEAGRIAAAVVREARRLGRRPAVRYEFDDREVDRLMEVDGVEESVVVAVELD